MSETQSRRGHRTGSKDEQSDSGRSFYLDILTAMTSGAMAGAVAKTTIAPLDRTKIIFQTSQMQFSVKNVIKVISSTVQQHGVLALWRGNSATMARIVPYAAIQFAAFEQLKLMLSPESRNATAVTRFVCGSLAGIIAAFCTYPLDLVRARMAVTQKGRYNGLSETVLKIYHEEGFRKFYRGFVPTMLGIVPYAGLSFLTYETCKSSYRNMTEGSEPNSMYRMAFGACAGFVGQSTTYPLDIVRRRMQTDGSHGKPNPEYRTIYSTMKSVLQHEGLIGGLYKGLSMNWLKGPIAVGISFTTYDFFHDFFRKTLLKQNR